VLVKYFLNSSSVIVSFLIRSRAISSMSFFCFLTTSSVLLRPWSMNFLICLSISAATSSE